jgi:hypothetical protein
MTRPQTINIEQQIAAVEAELALLSGIGITNVFCWYPIDKFKIDAQQALDLLAKSGINVGTAKVFAVPHRSPNGKGDAIWWSFSPESFIPPTPWLATFIPDFNSEEQSICWVYPEHKAWYAEKCALPFQGSAR